MTKLLRFDLDHGAVAIEVPATWTPAQIEDYKKNFNEYQRRYHPMTESAFPGGPAAAPTTTPPPRLPYDQLAPHGQDRTRTVAVLVAVFALGLLAGGWYVRRSAVRAGEVASLSAATPWPECRWCEKMGIHNPTLPCAFNMAQGHAWVAVVCPLMHVGFAPLQDGQVAEAMQNPLALSMPVLPPAPQPPTATLPGPARPR